MAFKWTKTSEQAAALLAEGRLIDEKIAEQAAITWRTLQNWKKNADFAARIEQHLDAFRKNVRRRGLAIRERRIEAQNDRWLRLQSIVEARADDESMQAVPGGRTGLLVRQVKGIGRGEDFQVVEEYAVDVGLLKELRELEKQAAQELGQLVEKVAPTDPNGKEEFGLGLTDEQRARKTLEIIERARLRKAQADAGGDGLESDGDDDQSDD